MHVQVGGRDVVAGNDWLLEGDDLVETTVGVEAGLDVGEDGDRTIGTSTTMVLRISVEGR